MSTYIVFDIGGTNMRVATATRDGLLDVGKVPTPQDAQEGMERFISLARELSKGASISAIAGCMPGELVSGIIRDMPNIPGWVGLNPSKVISAALSAPMQIVNDAGCVGLGEAIVGAGKGSSIMMYMTVSTGVGGSRIVDGEIARSAIGFHPGKQRFGDETLEGLVSGKAVQKKFGIAPKDLDSLEERNKLADILAVGVFNSCMHWSPDTVVLGGSMIVGLNPIPIERVSQKLTEMIAPFATPPLVKMAALKDNGGLEGARMVAARLASE